MLPVGSNAGDGADQNVLSLCLLAGLDLRQDEGLHLGCKLVCKLDLAFVHAVERDL